MPAKSATRTSRSTSRSSARKPSRTAETARARRTSHTRPQATLSGFPGWAELSNEKSGKKANSSRSASSSKKSGSRARLLDVAPSLRFAVWTLVACIAITLYVGHVYSTQATLAELQKERRENLRLRLTQDRLRGAFDRMTGPREVMEGAALLGLVEDAAYGPSITVNN